MKKSIFYFTPSLPPTSSAAAVRNAWFLLYIDRSIFDVNLQTGEDFLFCPPQNTERAVIRLLKELMCGLELAWKVLLSKEKIYFFSSPPFITVLISATLCSLLRKNYILDVRDLYPEVFVETGLINKNSPLYKVVKKLTSHLYKNAFAVLTVTPSLKQRIKKETKGDNVVLIMNGFDPNLFKPSFVKRDKFTVVFHGTLGRFQRMDLVVEVAKIIKEKDPDIEFVIAGNGPGVHLLKSAPSNLRFLGNVSYKDIPKLISECHVGLSLRTDGLISYEAIPVKIFEYTGCSLPVVVSPDIGDTADLVKNNKLGIAVPNTPDSIVAAILELKKNKLIPSSAEMFSRAFQSRKLIEVISKI